MKIPNRMECSESKRIILRLLHPCHATFGWPIYKIPILGQTQYQVQDAFIASLGSSAYIVGYFVRTIAYCDCNQASIDAFYYRWWPKNVFPRMRNRFYNRHFLAKTIDLGFCIFFKFEISSFNVVSQVAQLHHSLRLKSIFVMNRKYIYLLWIRCEWRAMAC